MGASNTSGWKASICRRVKLTIFHCSSNLWREPIKRRRSLRLTTLSKRSISQVSYLYGLYIIAHGKRIQRAAINVHLGNPFLIVTSLQLIKLAQMIPTSSQSFLTGCKHVPRFCSMTTRLSPTRQKPRRRRPRQPCSKTHLQLPRTTTTSETNQITALVATIAMSRWVTTKIQLGTNGKICLRMVALNRNKPNHLCSKLPKTKIKRETSPCQSQLRKKKSEEISKSMVWSRSIYKTPKRIRANRLVSMSRLKQPACTTHNMYPLLELQAARLRSARPRVPRAKNDPLSASLCPLSRMRPQIMYHINSSNNLKLNKLWRYKR